MVHRDLKTENLLGRAVGSAVSVGWKRWEKNPKLLDPWFLGWGFKENTIDGIVVCILYMMYHMLINTKKYVALFSTVGFV